MRIGWGTAANLAAGAVIAVLIVVALVLTALLGFAALALLGLVTWLICTRAALDQDIPVTSVAVFRAKMAQSQRPEERAQREAERRGTLAPLRFVAWCGILLTVIGAAGFLLQWRGQP